MSRYLARLTGAEVRILSELARFRYLTRSHLAKLGIGNANYVGEKLRSLEAKNLIQALRPTHQEGAIKLAYFYHLTKAGIEDAAFLLEREISFTHKVRPIVNDHRHRLRLLDCVILLERWCKLNDGQITMLKTYFEGSGKGLETQAHLGEQLVADAVVKFTDSKQTERLVVLEYERGLNAGKAIDKMLRYVDALHSKTIRGQFNYPHGERILFVFETPNTLKNAIGQAKQRPELQSVNAALFLTSYEKLQLDVIKNWQHPSGENCALYVE